MARERSPDRDKAFEIYQQHQGDIANREIAKLLDIPEKTISVWKLRDKWKERIGCSTSKTERSTTKRKQDESGNKNANSIEAKSNTELSNLTEKQVLFVAEYLTDFNATRAAMAVGYSKKSAHAIGWENLRKPEIQAEIQRQTAIVTDNLGITSQRVLLEYLKIAFADIGEYVTFGQREVPVMGPFGPLYEGKGKNKKPITEIVNYIDLNESAELDSSLISEVKMGRNGTSIKLHDKMKALEKLEKYLDLLPDNHKRRMEEEKLKLEEEKFRLEQRKAGDLEQDEPADDGFIDALNAVAGEVWSDAGED
ncbi:phage terminase, small subunit [Desulfitobacterium dehalogenans ATCC 51507]|uniref:Phage terminase, small subunit n=1 Tax=Desulfitobacterium dehalogenans (strain ATCC 51507 / DSM 9161 / JW/IU-DC1) TaxID=756499 RepID=I4A6C3_DESDJ|nr:terminase small subunit [Desulfitobacterium dehalogenans]AFL99507.1 phage terminase, small subunit [Desulfitobacterium dehalogenans ATCC 51507]